MGANVGEERPRVALTLTVVPEVKLMSLIKPVSPAMANNGLPSDSSTLNAQLKKLSFFCHESTGPRFKLSQSRPNP